MDSDSESKLISLITQLMSLEGPRNLILDSETIPLIIQIISLVRSLDLELQPKPESKLMSLVTQTISLFNSMDLDSQPKPLLELISLITQVVNSKDLDSNSYLKYERKPFFVYQISELELEPELMSLIHQIFSLVISMNSKWKRLISLSPQVEVSLEKGKLHVVEEGECWSSNKWLCLPLRWKKYHGEDAIHFLCYSCYGTNHEECEKAPLEIKHPLHPKHSLQLVLMHWADKGKYCYCGDEYLKNVFYYCWACDFAMSISCVKKKPVLSIKHPKWHEHTLAHFPRQASLTCDLCALANSSSPFYTCLLCDFVVHQSCMSLPHVIRISRHLHRLSFTHSFDQGDLSCGVCRRKIDKHYGGYSCIKNDCFYAAHSRCATQSNVWDGIDLEGVPEEDIEELESFVTISSGVIQHFSHQHHHLRLDENTDRDYDDKKECQACITPIYFGNFYSCMQCDFILHEACANLSRKINHPIHPHMLTLTLVGGKVEFSENSCSACHWLYTAGFFYKCDKEGCSFKLHVQCAIISEPLVHKSHMHPLFLTSKPGEQRPCCDCKGFRAETFNCIECECNFALCFKCAALPQKVRYKHDNHILTLSYGEETSSKTYWCEACEGKIDPEKRFYMCDEYCCVTLHIECLIGNDLYMKPGSLLFDKVRKVEVLPNNQHMSRPICPYCKKRSPHKVVFQSSGFVCCSLICLDFSLKGL